jgi:hypothetical protein
MADSADIERDVYRTLGAVEEGLKRKADASDVQVEFAGLWNIPQAKPAGRSG